MYGGLPVVEPAVGPLVCGTVVAQVSTAGGSLWVSSRHAARGAFSAVGMLSGVS